MRTENTECEDIYFKFIVDNKDHTSKTGTISPFSFDYRLNKMILCSEAHTHIY